jgi:hypothetical protein
MMQRPSFLFVFLSLLAGCGGRVGVGDGETVADGGLDSAVDGGPVATDSGSKIDATAPGTITLRSDVPGVCALAAGGGRAVWIRRDSGFVAAARAEPFASITPLGRANPTYCALAMSDATRACFGNDEGALDCANTDGSSPKQLSPAMELDPIRALAFGDSGSIYARRRTVVWTMFGASEMRTLDEDAVAVAGDFDPVPDDGTELAVASSRMIESLTRKSRLPADDGILAMRGLDYNHWLILDSKRALAVLGEIEPGLPGSTPLPIGGAVQAFAYAGPRGENLYVAHDEGGTTVIDAYQATLFFGVKLGAPRRVVRESADVVALAIDAGYIVWATSDGRLVRADRATKK